MDIYRQTPNILVLEDEKRGETLKFVGIGLAFLIFGVLSTVYDWIPLEDGGSKIGAYVTLIIMMFLVFSSLFKTHEFRIMMNRNIQVADFKYTTAYFLHNEISCSLKQIAFDIDKKTLDYEDTFYLFILFESSTILLDDFDSYEDAEATRDEILDFINGNS